jgi:hypothetical protein
MARKRTPKNDAAQVEAQVVETLTPEISMTEIVSNAAEDAAIEALIAETLEVEQAIIEAEAEEPPLSAPRPSLDAIIDAAMETASTAGVVDHGSHIGYTWVPEDVANEVLGPLAADNDVHAAPAGWEATLAAHLDEDVEAMVWAIKAEVDTREFFELQKNPENANIQRTLKKVRSQLVTKRAARVLLTCDVHPSFINRVLHDGSRYNVYALGKLSDVVYGLTGGIVSNAINLACLRSLYAVHKAGQQFTMEIARACASNKIRIDPAIRQHLTQHTVSASTAPTQASSTMQALATLKAVTVMGSARAPIYTPADSPIALQLEAMFAA